MWRLGARACGGDRAAVARAIRAGPIERGKEWKPTWDYLDSGGFPYNSREIGYIHSWQQTRCLWLSCMPLLPVECDWLGNPPHFGIPCNLSIKLLTTLLYDTCQPDWSTLTTHQQASLILGDPPSTLPKKFHHGGLQSTLPAILDYVSHLEISYITWHNFSGINGGNFF